MTTAVYLKTCPRECSNAVCLSCLTHVLLHLKQSQKYVNLLHMIAKGHVLNYLKGAHSMPTLVTLISDRSFSTADILIKE